MRYLFLIFFATLFSCSKDETLSKNGSSDKEIVITLAKEKWIEVYGNSINKEEPFVAQKKNDSIWIVKGTLPKPSIGGVAYAEVNVKREMVVNYTHGE